MMDDWQTVSLAAFLAQRKEFVTIDDFTRYKRARVQLHSKGIVLRDEVSGTEIKTKSQQVACIGEFLVAEIDAKVGGFGIVPAELGSAIVSSHYFLFEINEQICQRSWLDWFVRSGMLEEQVKAQGSTNYAAIRPSDVLEYQIPLPPLPEQQRIVARIEELARRVEEARGLRRAANEHTDLLFYSHAKQLRARLLNEYESRAIGEITTVTSGGTPDRQNPLYWQNGTIAWIKTGELLDGEIWDSGEKITDEGMRNSSARMFPADTVLIALYGQGQTRGRTGLLKIPATTNQACAAIFPQPELFDSRFMQVWLQSLYHEMRADNHGGAQPNWNGGMIKQIKIALPPLTEQRRIVAYLDNLQQKVDELRRWQAATQKELDALMPSVLAKAFAGEL